MLDLYHSLRYRLVGHCWACHRLVLLHTPTQLRRCHDTPAAIVLTDSEPVVPVSHVSA